MDKFEEHTLDKIEEKRLEELFRIDWQISILRSAKKIIKNSKEPLTREEAIRRIFAPLEQRLKELQKKG